MMIKSAWRKGELFLFYSSCLLPEPPALDSSATKTPMRLRESYAPAPLPLPLKIGSASQVIKQKGCYDDDPIKSYLDIDQIKRR